jgi:hypothetical protein
MTTPQSATFAGPREVPEMNRTSLGLYATLHGKQMRNGWKNAGLAWAYDFHPDLMWVSQPRQVATAAA